MNKKYFIIAILFTLILFASTLSHASEPSLSASVTPDRSTVGQVLTYTLSISGIEPDTLKITLPEKKIVYPEKEKEDKEKKKSSKENEQSAEESVPLYIIKNATRDDTETGGNRQVSIKIILSYYRTGTYSLPEIKIAGKDGITIGYKIPQVTIEELNKEGALEEIEPPVSLSGNYTRIIWIIAGLLLAAACTFLLYNYFKKRKKYEEPLTPAIPPIEIFLGEVESLKLGELIISGKINEYVFDISIIFRRYLSSMFTFDAAEMTTDEIASKIKKFMPPEIYSLFGEEIISNMRLWDFSKFAEFTPSTELLLQNLDATVSAAKKISGNSPSLENSQSTGSEDGTAGL